MRRSLPLLLSLSALSLVPAGGAHAQLLTSGGSPGDVRIHRQRYLAEVLRSVETTVGRWREARTAKDAAAAARLYGDDAMFVPYRGKPSMGADLREALAAQFAAESDFRAAMVDFSAGGSLAYYAGEFSYQVHPQGGEPYTAAGIFVLVLEQKDGGWKIRSHLERPDLDLIDSQRAAATPAPADAAPASTTPAPTPPVPAVPPAGTASPAS